MKRFLFFLSLCVPLILSATLYAQDFVPLRVGVHDGYTRLVFGWNKSVDYVFNKTTEGRVTLKFNSDATLDQRNIDLSKFKVIGSIDVKSTSPLIVLLNIPKSSKTRNFKIGKRIILDIYDPKNPDDLAMLKIKSKGNEASKYKTSKYKNSKETHKIDKPVLNIKAENSRSNPPPAAPPAFVLVPETLPELEKYKKPSKYKKAQTDKKENANKHSKERAIKKAVEQKEHVISLRGTKSMSMAAYKSFDSLWLVVYGGNSFSKPGLTSPNPDLFSDIETVQNDVIDVYKLSLPEEIPLKIKAVGGGLAWDVVMGDKIRPAKAVEPKRLINSVNGVRSGKIFWPLKYVEEIANLNEPTTGNILIVVTVKNATQLSGNAQSFVDFDVLYSPIGMVIRPKVDDLEVKKVDGGIEISRPNGLAIALPKDIQASKLFSKGHKKNTEAVSDKSLIFKFDEWNLGGNNELKQRENILLAGIHGQEKSRKIQDLIKLGKMFLAHGRGAEALGYFNFVASELPELEESAEFRAYRGASKALIWKSASALDDFLFSALNDSEEIDMWKSYVLADLGDWQQAAELLPSDYSNLYSYPYNIASRLAIVLAEINLRAGQVKKAKELMVYVDSKKEDELPAPMKAALQYLRGEAARQDKDTNKTINIWKDLLHNDDDLYRTKASLALTVLLSKEHKIDNKEVIDRLERLRYAWRGDGLEAQSNYWLGDAYFKDNNYIKGLNIMRQAASIAKQTVLAQRITSDMAKTFRSMFEPENLKNVSALDAVAVFEQFKELTPVGVQGDALVQRLAEHLVKSDLLARAAKLLKHQVDHRLRGKEKIRIAIRLAAIELLDKNPQKAIDALVKARNELNFISESSDKEQYKHEIELLRIRAYAQNKQYKKALSLIEKMPRNSLVNRLKADISWKANYWDIAAEALNDVIIDENISITEKLSLDQINLILNRAIALNLDNDRIALANMREKYSAIMLESNKDKARQFEVITRPRRSALLDNRDALKDAVSEVDLFKDFLESYRNNIQN